MKYLLYFLIVAGLVTINLQSCSDRDEPLPTEPYSLFNSNDSAAFCEILEMAYGPHLNNLCKVYKMRLDSVPSWPLTMVRWQWFDDIAQYRIVQLYLGINDLRQGLWHMEQIYPIGKEPAGFPDYGRISPRIWDLDSLRNMEFGYELLRGDFPAYSGGGKKIRGIAIGYTNITSIPLEMLTLPDLKVLEVNHNHKFSKMPDGWDLIPEDTKPQPTIYHFIDNALHGTCPADIARKMWFNDNEFNSVDWDQWEKINFLDKLTNFPVESGVIGPVLRNNNITGTIPDKILNDTLGLIYTYRFLSWQKPGYGLSNMPDEEEIRVMKKEYAANHPELNIDL